MKSIISIIILFAAIFSLTHFIASCKKDQNTKGITLLTQEVPASFPTPLYQFQDNPLSEEGFQLGKKLFYDGRLSIDGDHPCASCHQQIAAFGTFEHDRSHGVYNSHTLRNAPVLLNLAWSSSFHWDGEFSSLKDESAQPINGHIEMGESWDGIIKKLEQDADYRARFEKVFHFPFIRPEFVEKALAQFTGSLLSSDSRYDRFKKGTEPFTTQEQNGYNIYKANCATCHPEPMFTDYSIRNIGLPVDPFLQDYGRMRITGKSQDSLKFKVPTLRNCYISSNYMHDGRFNTLHQCIDHYRTGVQQSPTLDPQLRNGISLTNQQADDLFEFLRTLTDSTFMRNTRYNQ